MIEHPHAFQVHFALNSKVTLLAKSRNIPPNIKIFLARQMVDSQTIAILRIVQMSTPNAFPAGRFLYPLRYLRPVSSIFTGKFRFIHLPHPFWLPILDKKRELFEYHHPKSFRFYLWTQTGECTPFSVLLIQYTDKSYVVLNAPHLRNFFDFTKEGIKNCHQCFIAWIILIDFGIFFRFHRPSPICSPLSSTAASETAPPIARSVRPTTKQPTRSGYRSAVRGRRRARRSFQASFYSNNVIDRSTARATASES